jgi:hypothetical protein
VAWANEDDDGIYDVGLSEAHAHYVLERAANGNYSHRNPRIVPLYREPQPALTDDEREAIADAAGRYVEGITPKAQEYAATLRGLLTRAGGTNE